MQKRFTGYPCRRHEWGNAQWPYFRRKLKSLTSTRLATVLMISGVYGLFLLHLSPMTVGENKQSRRVWLSDCGWLLSKLATARPSFKYCHCHFRLPHNNRLLRTGAPWLVCAWVCGLPWSLKFVPAPRLILVCTDLCLCTAGICWKCLPWSVLSLDWGVVGNNTFLDLSPSLICLP